MKKITILLMAALLAAPALAAPNITINLTINYPEDRTISSEMTLTVDANDAVQTQYVLVPDENSDSNTTQLVTADGKVINTVAGPMILLTVNNYSINPAKDDKPQKKRPQNENPQASELEETCACWGDVANVITQPPGDGSIVDFGDINYLLSQMQANAWAAIDFLNDRPDLACADVANAIQQPPGDGQFIDFGDLNYLLTQMHANDWVDIGCGPWP